MITFFFCKTLIDKRNIFFFWLSTFIMTVNVCNVFRSLIKVFQVSTIKGTRILRNSLLSLYLVEVEIDTCIIVCTSYLWDLKLRKNYFYSIPLNRFCFLFKNFVSYSIFFWGSANTNIVKKSNNWVLNKYKRKLMFYQTFST